MGTASMTYFEDKLERLKEAKSATGDYMENGLLHCGKCKTPKQLRMTFPGKDRPEIVSIACQCMKDDDAEAERRDAKQKFDSDMEKRLATYSITDRWYKGNTFATDDSPESKVSKTCRGYVKKWAEVKENGLGLLMYGSVGTGKSFYACSIVNALLDKRVPAAVTSFPRLLNILQGASDRQAVIDHLQSYHLLVIDDLGAERASTYAEEQVFAVIDARVRSGLPMIITTNLSIEEISNPGSMQYKRIYDRIIEACPAHVRMVGDSRRAGNAAKRRELLKEILEHS